MATIECYYRWCPNHEAKHLPPEGQSGPFCNNDECTATPEALDEYARQRTLESTRPRLRFLVPHADAGGGLRWP
jgi:hypothetical protein